MDIFDKAKRSQIMAQVRSTHTAPERHVRRILHRLGYRFQLHRRDLPGTPDIVLPRHRTAIQVRGCFWHHHTCRNGSIPKTRTSFWRNKLIKNKERDKKNDAKLRRLGWKVTTIWECRLDTAHLKKEIDRIINFIKN